MFNKKEVQESPDEYINLLLEKVRAECPSNVLPAFEVIIKELAKLKVNK